MTDKTDLIAAPVNAIQVHSSAETSILAVISRAAADPACDIDKMERLMAMHERMQAKDAEQKFNEALALLQSEIPTVFEGAQNKHTGNTYADLDDITRTVKPFMSKHGFSITFKVSNNAAAVSVTGILLHSGGHREDTTLVLETDKGPGRNAVQALGSTVTYGKRYAMCSLLNITTGDKADDDGAASSSVQMITPAQAKQVQALLDKCSEAVHANFEKMYGDPGQIPKENYDSVVAGLNNSISKAAKAAKAAPQEQAQ